MHHSHFISMCSKRLHSGNKLKYLKRLVCSNVQAICTEKLFSANLFEDDPLRIEDFDLHRSRSISKQRSVREKLNQKRISNESHLSKDFSDKDSFDSNLDVEWSKNLCSFQAMQIRILSQHHMCAFCTFCTFCIQLSSTRKINIQRCSEGLHCKLYNMNLVNNLIKWSSKITFHVQPNCIVWRLRFGVKFPSKLGG